MSRLLNAVRRVVSRCSALPGACGGSINILFGLLVIPLVGIVGLSFDYGIAITAKTKLNNAADAVALAAVVTAKAYIGANPGQMNVTQNGMAVGINQGINAFNVNAGKVAFATVALQAPLVTRSGQTLTATISYTASVQNNFGKIFRAPTTTFSNTVTASNDLSSYLDFYLMIDVSGSMGLPATAAGMTQLAQINHDGFSDFQQGCMFACHYPGSNGWTLATTANPPIPLRSNAVNDAWCALLQRAANPTTPNQYRIGFYPYINQLATLAPLTGNLTTLNTVARCSQSPRMAFTNLLDAGTTQLYTNNDPSTGTGSGGTHFELALPQMQAAIQNYGTGSSTSDTKPFVFLITDGMQNSMHYSPAPYGRYVYPGSPSTFPGYGSAYFDGSQPAQLDPSLCTALKNAGATISILYIPYTLINFINNGGINATESAEVNSFSQALATPLKSCASPNYFYMANSTSDITASLSAMFDQALRNSRLTR